MKIRTFYALQGDIYKVKILTEDWSEGDMDLIAQFGEPEIDLGGSFAGPPAYSLATNFARLMTESPFNQAFDSRDYADAEDRANVWGATIAYRIEVALVLLRSNADTYTREEVETV